MIIESLLNQLMQIYLCHLSVSVRKFSNDPIRKASCSIIAFMAVILANLQILSGGVNDGLVAYFPLDGNATDMVSGNTGTIYGATE